MVKHLNYPIIGGTKYCNCVLSENVVVVLKRILAEIVSKYGFSIEHMEIWQDNHSHLLVSAPPKLSVINE
ncbi:hypothetical protein C5Z25_09820 [Lactobacillus sp. CBA3605]|uniref:transposase n=1 Tax=Lactobacillus sp. CBA3605 TaxID=2099788 RepID=UPI000CFDA7B5|nr:transposase [Lactobacillus sp. CBA3605]AVK62053.1 hypothetical protein C5Z25_09820 [Lactobacillus sp. CBA3605]